MCLQQLSWVEGRPIGSTSIDIQFHQVITERLSRVQAHLRENADVIAEKMIEGRFERFKCSYGTAAASTIPNLLLNVPGLEAGQNFEDARIENSSMVFSRFAFPLRRRVWADFVSTGTNCKSSSIHKSASCAI